MFGVGTTSWKWQRKMRTKGDVLRAAHLMTRNELWGWKQTVKGCSSSLTKLFNKCIENQNSYIVVLLIRVVTTKKDKKSKPQKAKPKKPEVSKDLSGVRVIQRKMAYIIGLPLSLADENVSFYILVSSSLLYLLGHLDCFFFFPPWYISICAFFFEQLLQRKEFFGQYGKVSKVSLSRTAGGAIQQFVNETCSV